MGQKKKKKKKSCASFGSLPDAQDALALVEQT